MSFTHIRDSNLGIEDMFQFIFILVILWILYLNYRAWFKNDAKRLYERGFFIVPFTKSLYAYTIGYRIILIIGLILYIYWYVDLIIA